MNIFRIRFLIPHPPSLSRSKQMKHPLSGFLTQSTSTAGLSRLSLFSVAMAMVLLFGSAVASAADWPYWRGPSFDGSAQATGLAEDWDPEGGEGSNLLWKREDIGGPCTPVVMNGRLYTIQRADAGTPREAERVVCLDAATGETLWENRYNVWMSDVPAERLGWSSVVADPQSGNVYALGACGVFNCMDGET